MKYLLALLTSIFASILLTACGSGDGFTNPVVIDPGGQTVRLDFPTEYGLQIPTSGNRVTVASNNTVTFVTMAGTNNILNIEPNVLVRSMEVSGSNNTVNLSNNDTVPTISVLGTNAILNVGADDQINEIQMLGSNGLLTITSFSANVGTIGLGGSNIVLRIPTGYTSKTTIHNTGANNQIIEQ
ncbi:MAG TPA: hypothetical protein VHA82_00530 [Ramlibacter sp.]|uniref:hypothetical protein n=1 Tax=Ramlibacter sp. TaxID=1917967 RepID=UPI002B802322|nr:hypothetical protein [Ramlibacter sp.]HVZ42265.1 hypothetical protein [Ramlibacter sp.]